jgi:amidase
MVHERRAAAVPVSDLCSCSVRELLSLLRARQVSARELMTAHLDRIRQINPVINAVVGQRPDDECLASADQADRALARGEPAGPLHGLPWAFKDLEAAVGFPFTEGSPIYGRRMPGEDTVLVERIRAAGAIPIGKTNIPEFGMGSHTYNRVYGTTRNPYDTSRSAGGSSGGAAAAVAAGLLPLADGSDLGGSLRNPASFNNVVGFRPSVGLVPTHPAPLPFVGFGVKGPIARTVEDAARLLSVIAGADARDAAAYPSDPVTFTRDLSRSFAGTRLAWCPDLGGLPVAPEVRTVIDHQRGTFEALGFIVEEACPDFHDADEIFLTIRQWRTWIALGALLEKHRDQLKPEAIWEIEAGARLTSADVAQAMTKHAAFLARLHRFQERYDFLACTVSQVPPFDASFDWPRMIDGVAMDTYISWMKSAYWITVTFCPAISVPAGFTPDGLPVGIQIVGRRRHDFDVLQAAHAFEQATQTGTRRPVLGQEGRNGQDGQAGRDRKRETG